VEDAFAMKKILCPLLAAMFAVSGCTPGAYKRSADLQVHEILKDRETRTLGYTPQVTAPATAEATPEKKAFAKIPTTPIPPRIPPVMEPAGSIISYGTYGPQQLFPTGSVSPKREPLSVNEARGPMLERLRLGPPSSLSKVQIFDLFQALEYAVQHSREYQNRMEDLYLATLDVTLERHLFSPRPFARTGLEYTGGQLDIGYRSALNVTNTVGIRQQLPYGGEIVAQGLFDIVRALNDNVSNGESAQAALSGTIPLLRGAGLVNLESLISAERELVYEVRAFEEFRRQFVVQVASQYFRLLTLQQSIVNRRVTYISAARLTEQSYAMYAAGRPNTNFLSVQRAQQQQFRAENDIIRAEDNYQSALDDFKVTLGMPVEQPLDIVPIALDVTPPNTTEDAIKTALRYRLDLQTATDRIEDSRRNVQIAKNGLLPDLDLTASSSIGNRTGAPGSEIDSRSLEYRAGVNLDLPVDRLAERNSYRRSLIFLERAQRSWSELRDTIVGQVRDDLRAIRSAESTLDIQQRNIDLAQRRLDYSNELLVLGRASDSRDSVEAQNSLLDALDSYESARATYQIQILQFLRDTGTLRIDPDAGALGIAMDRKLQLMQ
jgi:outer membrane protein TolC